METPSQVAVAESIKKTAQPFLAASGPPAQKMELQISFLQMLKVTAFAVCLALIVLLSPLILIMVMGLLLAVSLQPVMDWLERKMPHWVAALTIGLSLFIALVAVFWLIIPELFQQVGNVMAKAPMYIEATVAKLPDAGHLQTAARNFVKNPLADVGGWADQLLHVGQLAVGGMASFLLVFVFMVYFLVDGPRAADWIVAFFSPEKRVKIEQTRKEVTLIVSAYMLGQVVTSVLCMTFVFTLLSVLGVPAALLLAVVAGLLDVLPVIGFVLTIIPAAMFALTVSPSTALIVLVAFGAYHALENYLIVPKIYGSRLQLSGLAVLISLLTGALVGGILGAILVLPFVASYAAIEKIWLKEAVGDVTLAEHAAVNAK